MRSESHTGDHKARGATGPGWAGRLRRCRPGRRGAAHAARRRAAGPGRPGGGQAGADRPAGPPAARAGGCRRAGRSWHRHRQADRGGQRGRLAVRLFAGDPLLFSRASQQADACARARVRVEIVPGVSAATGVPGFAGIPLTAETGGLRVVHASDLSQLDGPTPGSLVVLGAEAGPVNIAKMLVAARLGGHHPDRRHLERDHHRSAHGGQQAGVGRGRPQGGRGEHADRTRSGPGRDRRGGRS